MRTFELVWDDDTVEHLARHGVDVEEAEEACRSRPHVLRARYGRYLVLGQTEAGRYLTVIVAPLSRGRATLITARDMDTSERRRYLSR